MTEQTINYDTGEISPVQQDPKALAGLFAKIAKVMGALERLPKSGTNTHFGYDFVDDEDVYDAIRSPLAAEGVAFFAAIDRVEWIDTKTVVYQTFTFADGKTGITHSCNWVSEAIDKQDKAIAKACTTGLKYFLLKNFILSTGDPTDDSDNDGAAKPKCARKSASSKASDNGKVTEADKVAFFAKVLKSIPYYTDNDAVSHTLKQEGFTAYKKADEKKMLAALEAHAQEAANKEAA